MLESILIRSGLKVGFYCSPHLVRFTERFRINGEEMPTNIAAGIINELRDVFNLQEPPTYFEATTAMALIYFARENTDIAIMEVGMGGRLDATNVINPLVTVITGIALDHQFFLGSRLINIAGEKAGIIKKDASLITGVHQPSIIRLFEKKCTERKTRMFRVGKDIRYRKTRTGLNYYGLTHRFHGLKLGLKGHFQNRNAAMAIAVAELLEKKGFKISSEDIRKGIRETSWPGRLQVVSNCPLIVLDGGHNPDAVHKMTASVSKEFEYNHLIMIIGIMEDKDIENIIKNMVSIADYAIYTRPDYYRSASPDKLMESAAPLRKQGEVIPSISRAIARAKDLAGPDDMILIGGSLFTVGEALTCIDPIKYQSDGF